MGKPPAASKERRLTPLWIISLFVGLTETVLGIAVAHVTDSGVQIALTAFVIAFPLLVAAAFFGILWSRPWQFYAPNEYGGVDPKKFVETLVAARGRKSATKTSDLPPEVNVVGNPDHFVLLFKAAAPNWSKSTKAMDVGTGCVVQVSTEHLGLDGTVSLGEAVTFVPGVKISKDEHGKGKHLTMSGTAR